MTGCLTSDGVKHIQGLGRGSTEKADRDRSGVGHAGLPDNLVRRSSGNLLALGRLGDRVEAGSLGHDGARKSEKGSERETHLAELRTGYTTTVDPQKERMNE